MSLTIQVIAVIGWYLSTFSDNLAQARVDGF